MEKNRYYANALRALAMDAIDKSKSGHPGAPLGMADMAEALWRHFYKHNPANPHWYNRDRFVLSNGHASMLLYSLLHLTGYDLSMDDIKNFRQFGSRTPGHPEIDRTPGVDMGTGPLGQGIASAVGMALAEKLLAHHFNKVGFPVMDHHTWVFLGDGCLMEGVSQEAVSLAGTLGLGKLIALYDSNNISIDGPVKGWFSEDVPARFEADGWHVVRDVDGHDAEDLLDAIKEAVSNTSKPSLIVCQTTIGYGSPKKAGSASCHGSPMGAEETAATKKALGWEYDPFVIPQDIYTAWDAREKGAHAEKNWKDIFAAYRAEYPELAAEFERRMKGEFTPAYHTAMDALLDELLEKQEKIATRVSGQKVLDIMAPVMPELLGGSADLSGSVGTRHSSAVSITPQNFNGNYLHYGVREFAMGTIMNGLALHGGFIPYGGTFLVFSDYPKNAIRLSSLMEQRVIWVLTHDSIGVGEDGPTHQPIEQLAALRLTPGVDVWRPCDTVESAIAWRSAVERKGPSCLSMSRQNLAPQQHTKAQLADIARGAYVLSDCEGTPDLLLIATGSEVDLAVQAARKLTEEGRKVRVVSMPASTVFDRQDAAYRESVLPGKVRARIAIEAAAADFWAKYVGLDGAVVGMTTFGESAPGDVLFQHFGFTVDHVVDVAHSIL